MLTSTSASDSPWRVRRAHSWHWLDSSVEQYYATYLPKGEKLISATSSLMAVGML